MLDVKANCNFRSSNYQPSSVAGLICKLETEVSQLQKQISNYELLLTKQDLDISRLELSLNQAQRKLKLMEKKPIIPAIVWKLYATLRKKHKMAIPTC